MGGQSEIRWFVCVSGAVGSSAVGARQQSQEEQVLLRALAVSLEIYDSDTMQQYYKYGVHYYSYSGDAPRLAARVAHYTRCYVLYSLYSLIGTLFCTAHALRWHSLDRNLSSVHLSN